MWLLFFQDEDEDSDDDDDGSEWDEDETLLESFETIIDVKNEENPIDEYIIFKEVMSGKRKSNTLPSNSIFSRIHNNNNRMWPLFTRTKTVVSTQDSQYYGYLIEKLSPEQSKGLNDVMLLADKKRAQYESAAINRQGGMLKIQQHYHFPFAVAPA